VPRQRYNDYAHLNPGLLRDRVTFYRRTVSKSSTTGANTITFTEPFLSNVPAKMNPEGGHRFFDAARFNTENLDTCKLRWQAGIETTMQLEFAGQRYEIVRADDVNERRVVLMLALRSLK
jgi:hypothetical protein